jgi:tetratricopeptide (TPR) repeat protein
MANSERPLSASPAAAPLDGQTPGGPDPAATTGDGPAAAPAIDAAAPSQRYVLADEIARGGMGVIHRATDTALEREVAIKVLQDKYTPDSGVARRFADEARITAQLQHPAIPPVHDLGTLPDGRPFLAMKLIKGQTLEKLLHDRTDVSAERGRFVAIFEQVCQAIAYAHAHNVIHRDLKPENVMVGSFGEVQVMDWGLAKVLTDRPAAAADPQETTAETRVVSLRHSDGSFTQAGSVLGTPAYMPPEQAVGAVGKVDRRSDVFGLGAVLAVILTGKPPFAAGSAETVRVQSAQGKLEECFARLEGCGADPELVALCQRCLAATPADRPADGGEVARAVAALRAEADERARRAELERARAEMQAAEQRKRRRVQLALAGALGLLLVAGMAFGWWTRERQARNAEAVAGLLEQCEQALAAGDARAAAVPLQAAQRRVEESGVASQAARLARCEEDLAVLRELDAVDQLRWTPVGREYPEITEVAPRYHEALGRFGADPDAVGVEQESARVWGSTVRDRLVEALDQLLRAERSAAVRAALQSLDPDPFRDAIRDAERASDAAALVKRAEQAEALGQPAGFAAFLGESKALSPERARAVLATAVQRRPGALGLLMTLGKSYPLNQREGAEERVRWYQSAVAAAPTNRAAHNNLGNALLDKKDLDGAIAEYREAIRLDPKYASPHNGLGRALQDKKDLDRAIAEYREAMRLDPKFALPHNNLGNALRVKGDLDGAIAEYREAMRLDPKLAVSHNGLGNVLQVKGDLDGAIAEYREAIRLDPKLAFPHNGLGWLLYGKGDLDGAIPEYREAMRLDPKLAFPHNGLGNVLQVKGDLDGAIAEYREAMRLDPKFALPHNYLGNALQAKGDLDGAIAEYKECLRLDPKYQYAVQNLPRAERMRQLLPRLPAVLAGKDKPSSPAEGCDFAYLCYQPFQKRYAQAARLYDDAFAADPKLAEDVKAGHRYDAACYAALAGCGKDKDADQQDDPEKARLRGQALEWLRADLRLHRRQAVSAEAAARQEAAAKMTHWLADKDLSGVRDPQPLAKLPSAEREAWQKFWAEVKATLAEAQKLAPPKGKDAGKR